MQCEERRKRAEAVMQSIDALNNRMYVYSENEEEYLESCILDLTGIIPDIWQHKSGNRQQCYSNMYSKLLLAYFIGEIKSGNFLKQECIDSWKNDEVDAWEDFFYDDVGFDTAIALSRILESSLKDSNYFQMTVEPVDVSDVDLLEDWEQGPRLIREAIVKAIPELAMELDQKDDVANFENICMFRHQLMDFDMDVVIITSTVLYEVHCREIEKPSELGERILKESRYVLESLLQTDFINDGLEWRIVDDEKHTISYYIITCSEVIGDGSYYNAEEAFERIHRYNYSRIYKLQELIMNMKMYEELCKKS